MKISWEWALIPLLTTAYQAFMKILAVQMVAIPFGSAWLEHVARSPFTAAILICEIASFLLWMRVLAVTDVSRAVPLTAISYTLIVLTGWVFFHEPVLKLEIIGSAFILSGVAVLRTA